MNICNWIVCKWEGSVFQTGGQKALFMMEIQRILFLLSSSLGSCCGSVEIQGVKELSSATVLSFGPFFPSAPRFSF